MKSIKPLFLIFFLFCSFISNAQNKKISFLVNGMCGMCEDRIENALDIKGISFASWNQETKMCNVTFNMKKYLKKKYTSCWPKSVMIRKNAKQLMKLIIVYTNVATTKELII